MAVFLGVLMDAEQRRIPPKPAGLGPKSSKIWRALLTKYDFRIDELRMLEDACREVDLIERMQAELDAGPLQVRGSAGQLVASPLVQELRQHRQTLRALFAALAVPDEDAGVQVNQHRAAAMAKWHTTNPRNQKWARREQHRLRTRGRLMGQGYQARRQGPDFVAEKLRDLQRQIDGLRGAASLRNGAISGGQG